MSPESLTKWCIIGGFMTSEMEYTAAKIIKDAYGTYGAEEVEAKLKSRSRGRPIYTYKALKMILRELPPKDTQAQKPAKDNVDLDIALSVREEMMGEKSDLQDWEKLFAETGGYFRKPNDPAFDKTPSIFDAEPYCSLSEEGKRLYKENTFMKVLNDAVEENTSMHEICRKRGLIYEALLV